jgi:transposase-like protein
MNCPKCDSYMKVIDVDSRQEWCESVYYCEECDKDFLLTTIYQTQSSLIESQKLEEIKK